MTTVLEETKTMDPALSPLLDLMSLSESQLDMLPDWLRDTRAEAIATFRDQGLPSRKDEAWRVINLKALRETAFVTDVDTSVPALTEEDLAPFHFPDLDAHRLVFFNRCFDESNSRLTALPEGVRVLRLCDALESEPRLIEKYLMRLGGAQSDSFKALNEASFRDAVIIHVAEGVNFDQPIRILSVAKTDGRPLVLAPRTLVVVDDGASATIVEDFVGLDSEDVYLTNSVTEAHVGKGAHLKHYFLERESSKAFHFRHLDLVQEAESTIDSHSVVFGASLVRNAITPRLNGSKAACNMNGLYLGCGTQQLDTSIHITHGEPDCTSEQNFRGILDEKALGNFTGRIVVAQIAQKTDAVQSSQNLLLSDDARAHSQPQLEIYADDVRCTHGATIGQIEPEALFYLMARGVPRDVARSMLVYAYASEGIENMELDAVCDVLKNALLTRLPAAEPLRKVF